MEGRSLTPLLIVSTSVLHVSNFSTFWENNGRLNMWFLASELSSSPISRRISILRWRLIRKEAEIPIYEYRCNDCGTISEFLVGITSKSESLTCKQCGGSQLEKVISISHALKNEGRLPGQTCCGREERCSTPPCSTDSGCRRG